MLKDAVEAKPLDGYQLRLPFEDGVTGVVDVTKLVEFHGVFAPLAEKAEFDRVRVEPDLGTVAWPGGADLDPDVLYALAMGESLP